VVQKLTHIVAAVRRRGIGDIAVVKSCQEFFGFELPSTLLSKAIAELESRYGIKMITDCINREQCHTAFVQKVDLIRVSRALLYVIII